jgi:hypothetical protein
VIKGGMVDKKWDGKEFHGREWIDYGLCGTKGKM